jgi:hypothetical protein
MSDIKTFTTFATKMAQKPSDGGEAITQREQKFLSNLLGQMSAGDKSEALRSVQGSNPELYAMLSKGW